MDLPRLTRKERIGVVSSFVWTICVSAFAVSVASSRLPGRGSIFYVGQFFSIFLVLGALPVVIGWGIYWVKKG